MLNGIILFVFHSMLWYCKLEVARLGKSYYITNALNRVNCLIFVACTGVSLAFRKFASGTQHYFNRASAAKNHASTKEINYQQSHKKFQLFLVMPIRLLVFMLRFERSQCLLEKSPQMIKKMIVDAWPSGTCVQHPKRLHFLDARRKLSCVPDMKFASKTAGRASARPLGMKVWYTRHIWDLP